MWTASELRCRELKLHTDDVPYFLYEGEIANNAYNPSVDRINILHRDGRMSDITQDSAQLNVSVLSETVTNYFLCYPKVKI